MRCVARGDAQDRVGVSQKGRGDRVAAARAERRSSVSLRRERAVAPRLCTERRDARAGAGRQEKDQAAACPHPAGRLRGHILSRERPCPHAEVSRSRRPSRDRRHALLACPHIARLDPGPGGRHCPGLVVMGSTWAPVCSVQEERRRAWRCRGRAQERTPPRAPGERGREERRPGLADHLHAQRAERDAPADHRVAPRPAGRARAAGGRRCCCLPRGQSTAGRGGRNPRARGKGKDRGAAVCQRVAADAADSKHQRVPHLPPQRTDDSAAHEGRQRGPPRGKQKAQVCSRRRKVPLTARSKGRLAQRLLCRKGSRRCPPRTPCPRRKRSCKGRGLPRSRTRRHGQGTRRPPRTRLRPRVQRSPRKETIRLGTRRLPPPDRRSPIKAFHSRVNRSLSCRSHHQRSCPCR